jgi:hypothetical protein
LRAGALDAPFFLPLYRLRQYGVVALGHEEASRTYTGTWTSCAAPSMRRAGREQAAEGWACAAELSPRVPR